MKTRCGHQLERAVGWIFFACAGVQEVGARWAGTVDGAVLVRFSTDLLEEIADVVGFCEGRLSGPAQVAIDIVVALCSRPSPVSKFPPSTSWASVPSSMPPSTSAFFLLSLSFRLTFFSLFRLVRFSRSVSSAALLCAANSLRNSWRRFRRVRRFLDGRARFLVSRVMVLVVEFAASELVLLGLRS
jgi:hypothetical protein